MIGAEVLKSQITYQSYIIYLNKLVVLKSLILKEE